MLINSWLTLFKNSLQKSNSRRPAQASRKRSRSVVSTQPAAEMLETRQLLSATSFDEHFSSVTLPGNLERSGNGLTAAPVNGSYGGSVFENGYVRFTGEDTRGDASGGLRTFLRTVDDDYSSVDFVAEVTVTIVPNNGSPNLGRNIAFFGLGTAESGAFGEPDSAGIRLNVAPTNFNFGLSVVDGGSNGGDFGAGGDGTYRLRMEWSACEQTATFQIDKDYTGGAFVADYTRGTFDGSDNGFNATNARIFIGGDWNTRFDDLSVVVTPCNASATVSVGNASVNEGNSSTTVLSFPVTLSHALDVPVSVHYSTQDGTAIAGSDYVAQSGTLTIPAGSTTGTVQITVNGDTTVELDETLNVVLSNVQVPDAVIYSNNFEGGATDWTYDITSTELTSVYTEFLGRFGGSTVNSTTINVGAAATVVISFDMFEFNSWDTELFQVFADGVLVVNDSFAQEDNYGDYDGTTKPNAISIDNRAPQIPNTFGHLTEIWHYEFTVNTTGPTLNLSFGSTLNQSVYDESWGIDNLRVTTPVTASLNANSAAATGTIVNNDSGIVSIGNASVTEGNSGTTVLSFPVTLSKPVDVAVSVDYSTQNGIATAGSDYVAQSGTLTIPSGSTTGTINITVNGDIAIEANETLRVNLSNIQASGRNLPGLAQPAGIVQLDASTLGLASGTVVSNWGGQTSAGTPTFLASQTPNGSPAVQFNAGGDRLGNNVFVPASAAGDFIYVAVVKANNIGAYHNLVDDDVSNRPMLWIDHSFNYEMNYGGGVGAKGVGAGLGGWDIVIMDSRLNQLYVNSATPNATGGAAVPFTAGEAFDFFHRDGGQTFQGLVAEARIYNDRAAFGGNFAALYNELQSKWFGSGLGTSVGVGTIVNDDFNTAPVAVVDAATTDEASTVTFNVLSNDNDAENNIVASLTVSTSDPTPVVLTDNGSGSFTFNPNGAFESLADGESTQVSFDYRIEDAYGETDTATVTITINGLNDAASISGDNVGNVTEDDAGDNGVLAVSDVDNGENVFQPQTSVIGTYGTFSINAAGNWSYTRTANLQSLAVGESVADSFTVVSLDGTASRLVTITVTGANDAPVMTGAGSNHDDVCDASANKVVTISGSFSDIDTSDTHTATVNWGDGTNSTVAVNQLADTLAGSHTYQNGGVYTVTVTVNDGKGGTATSTTTAVVQGVGVVNGTLYIIGTPGRDHVNLKFDEKKNELKVDVKLNQTGGRDGGKQTFAISSINRVVAYLCDGDDQYNGGSDGGSDGGADAAISQFVFGGAGKDNIQGGRGNDVLSGGSGNDDIKGGHGADILIGGTGKDNLQGGRGNDLIIGGSTANENDLIALDQALAEWSFDHLTAALNFVGTVTDDNEKDDLFGEDGNDYLHYGNGDKRKN